LQKFLGATPTKEINDDEIKTKEQAEILVGFFAKMV